MHNMRVFVFSDFRGCGFEGFDRLGKEAGRLSVASGFGKARGLEFGCWVSGGRWTTQLRIVKCPAAAPRTSSLET